MESLQIMISRADSSTLEEILSLLNTVDLPPDGVAEYIDGFLIARDETGSLVGCAGMEQHGELGLLRSVAVTPELQRSGLGTRLTEAILQYATQQGISEVLLLTTTARDFFEQKFGFAVAVRKDHDDRLKQSPEWRLPRCSSAVLMKVNIQPQTHEIER
jgi:amino-acid N-acetyltransferase